MWPISTKDKITIYPYLIISVWVYLTSSGCGDAITLTEQDISLRVLDRGTGLPLDGAFVTWVSQPGRASRKWEQQADTIARGRNKNVFKTDGSGRVVLSLNTSTFYPSPPVFYMIARPPLRDQVSGRKATITVSHSGRTEHISGTVGRGAIVNGQRAAVRIEDVSPARYKSN